MSTTSPIAPSIGRIVIVSLARQDRTGPTSEAPALVNGVTSNDNIDATVFPSGSNGFAVLGIPYNDEPSDHETRWHWMDYQLKVAETTDPVTGEAK